MIHYRRGKFKAFLVKYDWNKMFQATATILLGIGVGLYQYEQGELLQKSRPFFIVGGVLLVACLLTKATLYLGLWNANSLKGAVTGKKQQKRKRGIDINGILQEIFTVLLGLGIGMCSTPVVNNAVIFESTEYPDPTPGLILIVSCVFLKIILYSEALNFSQENFIQLRKVKSFLARYNWNSVTHEISSTMIGIGVGFYMYEAGFKLIFDKWFPGLTKELWGSGVAQSYLSDELGIFGLFATSYLDNMLETQKPLVITGLIIIGACILVKVLLYLRRLNMNNVRDSLLGQRSTKKASSVDYRGIADEIVSLAFTLFLGVLITPYIKNAVGESDPYGYQVFAICGTILFGWIKLALIVDALEFGQRRKSRSKR
ncbi:hypothetical protein [Candidatus Uabimicrobium sp. HlEnr_7]|uniref:hypothetical protein n=1 Tax=Candidatus Uabimicrobium helgolandensis TaxID=3095367 RepID=UPI003557C478